MKRDKLIEELEVRAKRLRDAAGLCNEMREGMGISLDILCIDAAVSSEQAAQLLRDQGEEIDRAYWVAGGEIRRCSTCGHWMVMAHRDHQEPDEGSVSICPWCVWLRMEKAEQKITSLRGELERTHAAGISWKEAQDKMRIECDRLKDGNTKQAIDAAAFARGLEVERDHLKAENEKLRGELEEARGDAKYAWYGNREATEYIKVLESERDKYKAALEKFIKYVDGMIATDSAESLFHIGNLKALAKDVRQSFNPKEPKEGELESALIAIRELEGLLGGAGKLIKRMCATCSPARAREAEVLLPKIQETLEGE